MIISGNPIYLAMYSASNESRQNDRIKDLQEELLQEQIRSQKLLNKQLEARANQDHNNTKLP